MPITRSSTRSAAAALAPNTRSAGRTNARRPPIRLGPRANTSRKKKVKKKTAEPPNPAEVAPDELLAAVPSDDEPEHNEKVIDTAPENVPSDDEPEHNEKVIDAASGKELKAVSDDDEPEDDGETIASGAGAGDESRPRSPAAESSLPPSSPPLASSSPLASTANSPLASQHAAPAFSLKPTRPLPRRQSPRSKTVPRPATGDVNDDTFSLAHRRRVPRRRSSVSSDNLWNSVGSEPQLNSDNLDDFAVATQGLQGRLDDDERAHVEDAHIGDGGGEEDRYLFADSTTVEYREPDDMEEPLADYDSPPPRRTRPSLSPRPSRSLSPASPPKPLRRGNYRSITVGPVSPGAISRSRSRPPSHPNTNDPSPSRTASHGRSRARRTDNALTPQLPTQAGDAPAAPLIVGPVSPGAISRGRLRTLSGPNTNEPSPSRAASRGSSRARRTGNTLTPQPPTQAGDAPPAPHAQGPHNLPIPPARGPPPPLPPAHTKPPFSRPAIAPAPVSPPSLSPSHAERSDDSTDDYGRTQEAKRRLEAARVARGYSPTAVSTADDDEDMQDYLAEVATNGFREDEAGRKSSRAEGKGKGDGNDGDQREGKGESSDGGARP
ncbi:hypothetical protein B0H14DRAFT_3457895 [Mycena olivaceomarginata]|nr:hypothetical protein B0H14DRAFT_3457895 [Mycena olivaceomarginata]